MYEVDWYLSECATGMYGKQNLDIFYFTTRDHVISNQQWLKMWKKVLRTVPFGQLFSMINRISTMLPGHQAHVLPMPRVRTVTDPAKQRLKCIEENNKDQSLVFFYELIEILEIIIR